MAGSGQGLHKFYAELAAWWPLLSAPADYAEEAAFYGHLFQQHDRPVTTLLELGCGGGNNAFHLKTHFRMTLTDLSSGMLAVSRALNPECEHLEGDMRTLRLGRQFDGVFVHDAVCYMTSREHLLQAIGTAYAHCKPGGIALFLPDALTETFQPATESGGHDGQDRALRYVEWTWDPDPSDETYLVDYAYLLREASGEASVVHDRHVEGLFSRATWLELLGEAGFTARAIAFDHSEVEPGSYEVFVATRPA